MVVEGGTKKDDYVPLEQLANTHKMIKDNLEDVSLTGGGGGGG